MIPHETLSHYLSHYGYLAVFLLSMVEGPIVTIVAAFLAAQGLLALPAVYGIVVLGDLIGDVGYYGIGRWSFGPLQRFLKARRPKLSRRIEQIGARFRSRPGRILLFGKLTHSAGFAVLLAAGAARIRMDTFFIYCILGTLPKSALLVAAGYFFGEYYKTLEGPLRFAGVIVLALLIMIIAYVLHRWNAAVADGPEQE